VVIVSALDRKMLRDLARLWPQALMISLVMAAGVATLILAVGAYRSLERTREVYYERHRFADVFATMKRAPATIGDEVAAIPGVATVETRIVKGAILDLLGMRQPATAITISLPDNREPRINKLYLRNGRLPEAGSIDEVVVNESFARAHGFAIGSTFAAIMNGRKRTLGIVGIGLSPEYVYAIGPGDLMPDDRRFAVIWMSEKALAGIFDMKGGINALSLTLLKGASEPAVIEAIDGVTRRYGGLGAYGRSDQLSHAFLDAELQQLNALARVIPPIFLFVSAFLINMTLSRLLALEREQIGLLKALGYGRAAIAGHYIKLVLAIGFVGIVIGVAAGTWFGFGLTRLYAEFFQFPFLIFTRDADIYITAAAISSAAAVLGAMRAVWQALKLPPAVAMQPPGPTRYQHLWIERLAIFRSLSQLTMMSLRHIIRWPLRALFTTIGLALSVSLLIVSLFSLDSVEEMIDVSFFLSQRQDATVGFVETRGFQALGSVSRLPGVMRVEPFRSVPVRLRNGPYQLRVSIQGKPPNPELARVVDRSLAPVALPPIGLMVDERVAEVLRLRRGDLVEVEVLGGWRGSNWPSDPRAVPPERTGEPQPAGPRGTVRIPVTQVIQSYFGLTAYMNLEALNDLLEDGSQISGAHIVYDTAEEDRLFSAIKNTPAIASIALQRLSLAKFRETLAKNINMMVSIYVGLAVIVALGVVYNSARIQLSEQARELASLRVLGFTRAEVSRVLLVELIILVFAAQPLGWVFGYIFSWITIQSFSSDLYRAPFVILPSTYARASLVVMGTAILSALLVRRRIDRFNLISVLKTRD
jgi:putative ABC transport system permease protein